MPGKQPFFALISSESLTMPTLAEAVDSGRRFSPVEFDSLAATLAAAIDDAHASGRVYGNISPTHLSLSHHNGYLSLTPSFDHPHHSPHDPFRDPSLAASGPSYPTSASDRYSFAAVLYFLLTANAPTPPVPSSAFHQMPDSWGRVLARALNHGSLSTISSCQQLLLQGGRPKHLTRTVVLLFSLLLLSPWLLTKFFYSQPPQPLPPQALLGLALHVESLPAPGLVASMVDSLQSATARQWIPLPNGDADSLKALATQRQIHSFALIQIRFAKPNNDPAAGYQLLVSLYTLGDPRLPRTQRFPLPSLDGLPASSTPAIRWIQDQCK